MTLKWNEEQLKEAVANSISWAEVLRRLGCKQYANTQRSLQKRVRDLNLDVTHFKGQAYLRGRKSPKKKNPQDILVLMPPESIVRFKAQRIRSAMIESGVKYECNECGCGPEWRDKPLRLQIDHINGEWRDNRIKNLQFLCPNCHDQKTCSVGVVG